MTGYTEKSNLDTFTYILSIWVLVSLNILVGNVTVLKTVKEFKIESKEFFFRIFFHIVYIKVTTYDKLI